MLFLLAPKQYHVFAKGGWIIATMYIFQIIEKKLRLVIWTNSHKLFLERWPHGIKKTGLFALANLEPGQSNDAFPILFPKSSPSFFILVEGQKFSCFVSSLLVTEFFTCGIKSVEFFHTSPNSLIPPRCLVTQFSTNLKLVWLSPVKGSIPQDCPHLQILITNGGHRSALFLSTWARN